jgi:hypothetical protein
MNFDNVKQAVLSAQEPVEEYHELQPEELDAVGNTPIVAIVDAPEKVETLNDIFYDVNTPAREIVNEVAVTVPEPVIDTCESHPTERSFIEEVFPENDDEIEAEEQKQQDQEFWSTLIATREAEYTEEKTSLFAQIDKITHELQHVTEESNEKEKVILSLQSQSEQQQRLLDFFHKEQENQRVELVIYKHKAKELEEKCQNFCLENEKLKIEINKQKSQLDKFSLFQSTNDEFQDILAPMRQKPKIPVLQVSQTTPKKESMMNKLKSLVTSPRKENKSRAFFSASEEDPGVISPRKMRDDVKRKTLDTTSVSTPPKKVKL